MRTQPTALGPLGGNELVRHVELTPDGRADAVYFALQPGLAGARRQAIRLVHERPADVHLSLNGAALQAPTAQV